MKKTNEKGITLIVLIITIIIMTILIGVTIDLTVDSDRIFNSVENIQQGIDEQQQESNNIMHRIRNNIRGYKEVEGASASLTLNECNGEELKDFRIYGNSQQNGTPTPDNPIEIESVGDLVTEGEYYGKYRIPITATNGTETYTTNIYLDEPLRKIGDYVDYLDIKNKKVVRSIGSVVLDGSEGKWSLKKSVNDGYIYENSTVIVSPDKRYTAITAKSNHFLGVIAQEIWTGDALDTIGVAELNKLRIYSNISSDANSFIQWLSTHNTEVIYLLTTPIEETIELPPILTTKGTCTISVDTSIQPINMYVKYELSGI